MWFQKHLLVYGSYSNVKVYNQQFKLGTQYYTDSGQKVVVQNDGYYYGKDSKTGQYGRGEWRYLGFDVSGNPFSNINFIRELPKYITTWT